MNGTENNMSLFNELMTSVYLYILMMLTDFNADSPLRETFGLMLLGTVLFTFFVNIVKVLSQICKEIYLKIRRYRLKKQAIVKLKP